MDLSNWNNMIVAIMALSGIFFFMRDAIIKVIKTIADLFIYKLNVAYSDYDYHLFNRWLTKNEDRLFLNRSFRPARWEGEEAHPGYGFSFLKLPGFPLIYIYRFKDDSKTAVYEQTDCIHMSFFTFRKQKVKEFITLVKQESKTNEVTLYTTGGSNGNWLYSGEVRKVLTPTDAVSLKVVATVENFLRTDKWQGLAHKLGIMLHGEPGTGKTCLIAYLAHHFNLPVYSLGPAANFQNAIRGVTELPAIVAVEDIDLSIYGVKRTNIEGEPKPPSLVKTTKPKKLGEPKNDDPLEELEAKFGSMSLHEILNSLDGLQSVDGMIFIFTTNKIDSLDPALLRPGRVDFEFEMKRMTVEEQYAYVRNFGIDKLGRGLNLVEPIPVCQLQKMLLQSRNAYLENEENESGSPRIEYAQQRSPSRLYRSSLG